MIETLCGSAYKNEHISRSSSSFKRTAATSAHNAQRLVTDDCRDDSRVILFSSVDASFPYLRTPALVLISPVLRLALPFLASPRNCDIDFCEQCHSTTPQLSRRTLTPDHVEYHFSTDMHFTLFRCGNTLSAVASE